MTFDYLERVVVDGELEVNNIGDCIIQGQNDFAEKWYLIIKTELGWTDIMDYGPIIPDVELLSPNFKILYNRIEYNQGKLEKTIDKFLNDPKRGITQAQVVNFEDIQDELFDPVKRVFKQRGACDA